MSVERLSTRTIARVFFTLVALALLLYLVYRVRLVVGLVFIAAFLAIALGPAVDLVSRRRVPRGLAILTVYLWLLLTIFIIGLLLVPPIVEQVERVAQDAPGYIEDIRRNDTLREYDDKYEISHKLEGQAEQLPSRLGDAAGALQAVTVGVFSALVQLLAVLTIAFFLLLDGGKIVNFAFAQMSPSTRGRARQLAADVYRSTGRYVAGALTISVLCGVSSFLMLTILGVPFAVPLSLLMAFLSLIPMVGATVGAVIVGLVTLFHDFPTDTLAWTVFAVAYQQLETNVLQPQVYKRTVNLHPLAVIVALLVGAALLGVLGALVAIPVAAAVQLLLQDVWAYRRQRPPVLDASGVPIESGSVPSGSVPPEAIGRSVRLPPPRERPGDAVRKEAEG